MFSVLQLFTLFVALFLGKHESGDQKGPQQCHQMCNLSQGKVAQWDGKSLCHTSRNLVDDVGNQRKRLLNERGRWALSCINATVIHHFR